MFLTTTSFCVYHCIHDGLLIVRTHGRWSLAPLRGENVSDGKWEAVTVEGFILGPWMFSYWLLRRPLWRITSCLPALKRACRGWVTGSKQCSRCGGNVSNYPNDEVFSRVEPGERSGSPRSSCCLWLRQSLSMVASSCLCCWMIFFRAVSRSCCCFWRNSCSWTRSTGDMSKTGSGCSSTIHLSYLWEPRSLHDDNHHHNNNNKEALSVGHVDTETFQPIL